MFNRFKEVRETLGLTQKQLAERLGVTDTYISLVENGKTPIGKQTKSLFCNVLKVNEDWLETGNGDMFAPEPVSPLETLNEINLLVELARRSVDKLDEKTRNTITAFVTQLAAKLSGTDGKEK